MCLTCLTLFSAPIWIAHSWSLASLSLPLIPQFRCLKLHLGFDLSSPIWLQFAYVPRVYELLVPLSSISGPSNLPPEPRLAQPSQLYPGYKSLRQTQSGINEEGQEGSCGEVMSFSQMLSHPQIHRNHETGLHQGKSPPCLASPQAKAAAFLGKKAELRVTDHLQFSRGLNQPVESVMVI